ncbi:SRPBCC family protein [Flagellimonas sp.]|uniref:SRPBCC family protein n=1 Tax=Flagellimonas sp. TaxID=2058762 RepID=UPI003F4A0F6F
MKISHKVYIPLSPEDIFSKLTNSEIWNIWFTTECSIGKKIGDEVEFIWKDFGVDHLDVKDGGKIIVWDPPHSFGFTWRPGESMTSVIFTLNAHSHGTVLELEESGYSNSKKDFKALIECAVGWGEALTLLKFYLEYGVVYGKIPPK